MSLSTEELEKRIGSPDSLIVTLNVKMLLRAWMRSKGHDPLYVDSLTAAELATLYHAQHGENKTPGMTADAIVRIVQDSFVRILETVQIPGFNVDLTREIAAIEADFIAKSPEMNAVYEAAAARAARAVYDDLPARRIEVVTPAATVILDGPRHEMTETVIRVAGLGHAIMLVGPAGCGKTTIGEHAARALSLPFYITSTINDTHELTGFVDGYGKYHSTPFRQAFEHGGLWVADEIDAWDASALLAANSALANGYSVFPDNAAPVSRHASFRMVATANTFGNGADRIYIGRNELDAASLDRFATINVGYDTALERMFCNGNTKWLEQVWKLRKRVQEKRIRHVVSSRAIAMGSQAIAAGIKWEDAEEMYLYKGMSATDREKVK